MSKPYSFIPFLPKKSYYSKGDMSGKIYLKIEALTPIHISQDSCDMNEVGMIFKEFYKINEKYAIPGSSLKGIIRSIVECVSYSCASSRERIFSKGTCRTKDKNGNKVERCISCKMFGAMGLRSKLKISDFIEDDICMNIIGIPQLRRPKAIGKDYKDSNGNFIGHKIYNHGTNRILERGPVKCNFAKAGSVFKGSIIYDNLTEEQLMLLCYSLGLAGDFNHKIGYGKPAYYGSLKITIDNKVGSNQEKYINFANRYKETINKDIKSNMNRLKEEYSFENAKKTSDWVNGAY